MRSLKSLGIAVVVGALALGGCDDGSTAAEDGLDATSGADAVEGGGPGALDPATDAGGEGEVPDPTADTAETPDTDEPDDPDAADTPEPEPDTSVDAGPSDCIPPEGTPTWNEDVGAVLTAKCGLCHAAEPIFGAPVPLASYPDLFLESPQVAGATLADRAVARILDGTMPPPSQPQLDEAEIADVLAWYDGCAPEGPGEFVPPEVGGGKVPVPPPPPGAEIIEVRANDYPVPVKEDQYICVPMTLDLDGAKHIVRFGIEIDVAEVIHHVVLYADPNKQSPDGPFNCGGTPPNATFMYAWAPGGQDLQFPPSYGYPVQDGDVVILQMHYNNGMLEPGLVDDTGVDLYVTDPQPNEIGMVATGKLGFQIPPFEEATIASQCVPKHDITIVASMPHMHEIGKSFQHTVIRGNGDVETIVEVENWSFGDQPFYWTPTVVTTEDRMITSCTFQNDNAFTVTFGDDTEDEMCFNFFYHYPPLNQSFCDQLITEDVEDFEYSPGMCADRNAPMSPPPATGSLVLTSDAEYDYGPVDIGGIWTLGQLDLALDSFETPLGPLSPENTKLVGKGYMSADGDEVVLDVVLLGELALGIGLSYPFEFEVSARGTYSISASGKIELDLNCGSIPIDEIQVASKDGSVVTSMYYPIPQAGIDLRFDVQWAPLP